MEILPIFGEKLFAFKYAGECKDEFERLFDLWNDPEYLEDFFETHSSDLKSGYWRNSSVEEAVLDTLNYAKYFEDILFELSEDKQDNQPNGLESLFRLLSNSSYLVLTFDKRKARDNWLRLYALRVEKDVYIITGGAIKLTLKMQDREHTNVELHKLESCKRYLLETGIVDVDGLIEEIES